MAAAAAKSVFDPSDARVAMARDGAWDLIDDLCGGTRAMQRAGQKWLPKEEGESLKAYRVRLARTQLYGALKDTLRRLRSKPFSEHVTLSEKLPDAIAAMEKNVDGEGQDLTQFAAQVFDDASKRGMTILFTTYPNLEVAGESEDQRATRINAQVSSTIQPYIVHIKAEDFLEAKSTPDPVEGRTITLFRYREWATVNEGDWGSKRVQRVRVLRPDSWELWEKDEQGQDKKVGGGSTSLKRIAIVPIYFQRTGFFCAEPPMLELAWCNLEHWQSNSDQKHILRFSRFGLLFYAGKARRKADGSDDDSAPVVGPSRWIEGPEGSTLNVVEPKGTAIAAGRQDVLDIEARMEVLGLAPLMERTGDVTATGRAMDESRMQSDIQSWIRSLELGLARAFALAAEWKNATLPAEFRVKIFSDFGISSRAAAEITAILQAKRDGLITHARALKEMQRRSMLGEDMNVEEEVEAAQNEAGTDGLTHDDAGDGEDPPEKRDPAAAA